MKTNDKHDVFISYRRSDGEWAARLIETYLRQHNLKVFVDFKDMYSKPGYLEKMIRPEIKKSTDFLLLITPNTFSEKFINDPNDWITKEILWASSYRRHIAPLILYGVDQKLENIISHEQIKKIFCGTKATHIPEGLPPDLFEDHLSLALRGSLKSLINQKAVTNVNFDSTEQKRVNTQAKITSTFLKDICNQFTDQLVKDGRTDLTVLDVGCANGELGRNCFDAERYSKVYGIDINSDFILEAADTVREDPKLYNKYVYKKFDVTEVGKTPKKLLEALKVEKFDVIFCSMILHYFKPDENYVQVIEILEKFKDMLTPGGYLIVNNPDDSSKLAYEDNIGLKTKQDATDDLQNMSKGALGKLVQLTSEIPGVTNRYCGRATYYCLSEAGFKDITIRCVMQDTSNLSHDEKMELFTGLFGWQQGQIDRSFNPELMPLKQKDTLKKEVIKLTNAIKTKLGEKNFWFCSHEYVGIAKKES